jgi:hypothetical protein
MKDNRASSRERKAALDEREEALKVREAVLEARGDMERELLADADRRDVLADARDMVANRRDMAANIQGLLHGEPGDDSEVLMNRVDAAADRKDARSDRTASRADRIQLTNDESWQSPPPAAGGTGTRTGLITYQMSNAELAQVAAERLDAIGFQAATDGGTRVRITRDADEESQVRRLLGQIDPGATPVV